MNRTNQTLQNHFKTVVNSEPRTLEQTYRLYSSTKKIKNNQHQIYPQRNTIKQSQLIELVFPHPNLLFINPNKVVDSKEKQNIAEYNILTKIMTNKANSKNKNKNQHSFKSPQSIRKSKPFTAPVGTRKELKKYKINGKTTHWELNMVEGNDQNQQSCRKSQYPALSQNQDNSQIKTFQSCERPITQKRQTTRHQLSQIQEKFEKNKISRQNKYKNCKDKSLLNYISVESKFFRHFVK